MIARYVLYTLAWVLATIAGIFGGYHLARYANIGTSIWGNSGDGYTGDANYHNKEAIAWWMPSKAGLIVGLVASAIYSLLTFDIGLTNVLAITLSFTVFNAWATFNRKAVADYNWSALRNPANNLLRHTLNAEGVINKIDKRSKNLTIITMNSGKRYFFYYNKGGKYIVKFGHRFWADQIEEGKRFNASFVFNP